LQLEERGGNVDKGANRRTTKLKMAVGQAELWYETGGFERNLSHPLNATTPNVQQNARHVNAIATFKNIMTSKR
jgi:hypothetical protein